MARLSLFGTISRGIACALLFGAAAHAEKFNIPSGDLTSALDSYTKQTGVALIVAGDAVRGARTSGVHGNYSAEVALAHILTGTGFDVLRRPSGAVMIVPGKTSANDVLPEHVAAATAPSAPGAALETVTVTSSKIGGDVQNIPIAITALSQEQLTATQTAGGPDLIKQVPNMTFTKTNFSGYSIQIRGIGTQAISVTTDPAVAVAFNDIPFIRNHFFEQEFFDVASVEVARGPQGTLYGRNATAGVVNLVSAKPSDQFEAMASADIGNYQNRRLEAMVNIPVIDDRVDIRVAGEWTKRQGYSTNQENDERIDGRDLWSGRVTIGLKPIERLQMYFVWERFSEDDDRIRSSKQLCMTDPGIGSVNGYPKPIGFTDGISFGEAGNYFDQGCKPASLYSPDSFEVPNGLSLPYITGLTFEGRGNPIDPYASQTQSHNLRVVDSGLNPSYSAKNDVVELNADYTISPSLTFTSQTGFGHDFLFSTEDYNRFGAAPGLFIGTPCDPQLGCSDRLILEDLSQEHAWQLSQEFRVTSNFSGPFNFSAGGNYLHYETEENYYVFGNVFTQIDGGFEPGEYDSNTNTPLPNGFQFNNPNTFAFLASGYVDPNPISHLDGNGHNYFVSKNPYLLSSYAAFGEGNYNLFSDLKLTAGLRWTEDRKHFSDIPSWLVDSGWGYPVFGVVNQQWDQFTGRAVANWTPKLDFTDQTLVYGSYAHGYKAGGANPPGAIFPSSFRSDVGGGSSSAVDVQPTHPLTFKPEFVDAFELGTKNTLLDGALTLNGDFFYYNYENYQVSEIVDRTAINLNFDAHAKGAELEATWEPLPGLRFNFAGGWEDTALAKGDQAVDLMDRTAGNPNWFVVRPFVNEASNCIFPTQVAQFITSGSYAIGANITSYCAIAYDLHLDPLTQCPYVPNPTQSCTFEHVIEDSESNPIIGYVGFDPTTAPNDGAGISKNLSGNKLPNAPPYTVSVGAQYTVPLTTDWAGTLRSDFYWQDASWWRVFNDLSYDRLRGYDTVNLTLILTSQTGWQVMLYDKNVFNTTAITGAFLNSDDSGLTTNVFLTDPKLIGIRVTKNW
ncbi:MAG TPA: TonB-dependent receptor [Rhizomicrobium sp.]